MRASTAGPSALGGPGRRRAAGVAPGRARGKVPAVTPSTPSRDSRPTNSPAARRVKVTASTWRASASPSRPPRDAAGQHPRLARSGRAEDRERCWNTTSLPRAGGVEVVEERADPRPDRHRGQAEPAARGPNRHRTERTIEANASGDRSERVRHAAGLSAMTGRPRVVFAACAAPNFSGPSPTGSAVASIPADALRALPDAHAPPEDDSVSGCLTPVRSSAFQLRSESTLRRPAQATLRPRRTRSRTMALEPAQRVRPARSVRCPRARVPPVGASRNSSRCPRRPPGIAPRARGEHRRPRRGRAHTGPAQRGRARHRCSVCTKASRAPTGGSTRRSCLIASRCSASPQRRVRRRGRALRPDPRDAGARVRPPLRDRRRPARRARLVLSRRRVLACRSTCSSRAEMHQPACGPGIRRGMEIELVRGTRRRKHVEAVLIGDRLRVSFPRWMSLAEADEAAKELADRMRRRVDPSYIDVGARTRRLAREYGLPRPRIVRWSEQQRSRWGSCTRRTGRSGPRPDSPPSGMGARLRPRARARALRRPEPRACSTTSSSTATPTPNAHAGS